MEVDHVQSLAKAEEYFLQEKPALVLLDNRCRISRALANPVKSLRTE